MNTVLRSLQSFFSNLLLGERKWGYFRFLFVSIFLILFTYLGHFAFRRYPLDHIVQTWFDRSGLLKLIPGIILRFLGLLIMDFRFLWVSLAAFVIAMLIGASYLKDIYGRSQIQQTLSYLFRSLFAIGYPSLTIDKGRLQLGDDDLNLIRDIGGPGRVVVQPGNVVLFEHLHTPSKIQAEGVHFISRFETVRRFKSDFELDGREIPTLDERHGFIEAVSATTKDGVTVIVENINYRYRLRMGREFGDFVDRDPENPNPFSVQAVKNMAYNRTVRLKNVETGETDLTPWHNMVNIAVDGAITEYIRENQFNNVVVPQFPEDPRQKITERIFSKGVRERLRTYGAELLWWDIGHFKVADPVVADQLVENWGTIWQGEAAFRLARGEAERIKQLNIGRAEAQAEMLIKTMEAFENLQLSQMGPEKIRNIMLARLAQLMDGMSGKDS